MRRLLASCLLAAACSPRPEPAASPPPASSAAPPPSAAFTGPPHREPPPGHEVAPLAAVACTLVSKKRVPVRLFVEGDAEPWATVTAFVRFELPAKGAPVVTADAEGLHLRGVTRLAEIDARFAVARFFGGVFMPEGPRPLVITSVSASGVGVRAKTPKPLRSITAPMVVTVPCAELTADEDANPDLAGRVPDVRTAKLLALRPDVDVPVRPTADGEPTAVFTFAKGSDGLGPRAWIMGTASGQTHVFLRNEDGLLDGWVPSDVLLPLPASKVSPGGFGGGGFGGVGISGMLVPPSSPREEAKPTVISCTSDTPLFVDLAGKVHLVGRVLANAPMVLVAEEGERTKVVLERGGIEVAPRATVFVRTDAVAQCARGAGE